MKNNKNQHPVVRDMLLYLGQFYHRVNVKIQRKLIGMEGGDSYVKPLKDEKALEQGAEFFGEIIAYGTLLIWGSYELIKANRDTRIKETSYAEMLAKIHAQLDGLDSGYEKMQAEIGKLKGKIEEEEKELSKIETSRIVQVLRDLDKK